MWSAGSYVYKRQASGGNFIIVLQSWLFGALLGDKGVNALQPLRGLFLVMMPTHMLLDGIGTWMKG
ncbi:MarC family protein [Enterobacter sichuanensis]